MRTIDANQLRTKVDEFIGSHRLTPHERLMFETFKNFIDDAPTIEPQPEIPPELLAQVVEIIREILPQVVEIAKEAIEKGLLNA